MNATRKGNRKLIIAHNWIQIKVKRKNPSSNSICLHLTSHSFAIGTEFYLLVIRIHIFKMSFLMSAKARSNC